jgi:hypothetical protein
MLFSFHLDVSEMLDGLDDGNSPEVFHDVQLIVNPVWTTRHVNPLQRNPYLTVGRFAVLTVCSFEILNITVEIPFQPRQCIVLFGVLL